MTATLILLGLAALVTLAVVVARRHRLAEPSEPGWTPAASPLMPPPAPREVLLSDGRLIREPTDDEFAAMMEDFNSLPVTPTRDQWADFTVRNRTALEWARYEDQQQASDVV